MNAATIRRRLSLRDGETAVQVGLGLAYVGIAWLLWLPGDTFAISDSYDWFEEHLTERTAGWVLFVSGTLVLLAPLSRRRAVEMAAACWLGFLSLGVAIGFWRGSALSVGTVVFVFPFSWLSYWLMWRRSKR